jgi:septum site-determining protein MinD
MIGSVMVIASGKGGTGKTTLSVNIATALAGMGEKTILIDADLGMPNVSMLMEIGKISTDFYDVLKGTAGIKDAIYDGPAGLKVVPCSLSLKSYQNSNIERIREAIVPVKAEFDHIIIDTPPGISRNVLIPLQIADKIVLVVNNNVISIVDSLKSVTIAKSYGRGIDGVIVNRVSGEPDDCPGPRIQDKIDVGLLSEIPDDPAVSKALSLKTPVVTKYPQSKAAVAMKQVAVLIAGIELPEYTLSPFREENRRRNWFGRIKTALFE